MKKLLILIILLLIVGCEEAQKTATGITDPMTVILKPTDSWKAKYGDSSESVLVYNLVVLDYMNRQEHNAIKKYIAVPNDPNSIESRIKRLENKAIIDGDIVRGYWPPEGDPNWNPSMSLSPMYIYKVDPNRP